MSPWLNRSLRWISLALCLCLTPAATASAQEDVQESQTESPKEPRMLYPRWLGEQVHFTAYIEMPKAYLSGLCILVGEEDGVNGSLINEFGISALDFSYRASVDKVKLHHVIKKMNKWYIRRVLRSDLRSLLHQLQQGRTTYEDRRYHITYTLTEMEVPQDETER